MEPNQTHGATLPQQGLTQPAGGCPSGPRPEDLLRGGHEGANPHVGRRVANEAVDCATAGASHTPGVRANKLGGLSDADQYPRLYMYECFAEESKKIKKTGTPTDLSYTELLAIVIEKLGHKLKPSLSTEDKEQLSKVIRLFLSQTKKMFQGCKSNKTFFKRKHKQYLEKSFLDDIPRDLKRDMDTCSASEIMVTLTNTLTDTQTDALTDTQTDTLTDTLTYTQTETLTETLTYTLTDTLKDSLTVHFPSNASPSTEPCDTSTSAENMYTTFESAYYSTLGAEKHTEHTSVTSVDSYHCEPSTSTGNTILDNTAHYDKLSYRQQLRSRKSLAKELTGQPPTKLIKTFTETIESDSGNTLPAKAAKDLEHIIHTCLKSPNRATKISKKLTESIQPYTPEEALGLMIDRKLTVETYKVIQQEAKSRGCTLYPNYPKVSEARKACYPNEQIFVSDVEASVSLQAILNHTFERILQNSEECLMNYCDRKGTKEAVCVLEGSWGYDGSSGQSLYKQSFNQTPDDPLLNENSMFATTFVPLRIKVDKKLVLWLNPTPQSYRFCRPIHLQYKKETTALILAEKKYIEEQIEGLTPITVQTSKHHKITCDFDLTLSVIDGKVLNIITGTSSQLRCPICKITASNFNNLEHAYTQPTCKEAQRYGINPLHAWIRVLEFLLHLGYKNDPRVRIWRVNKKTEQHQIVEDRKKKIQAEIRTKMGLLVDVVRPQAGTTNDGNTARSAMSDKNRYMFAEILELESWLVEDLHTILVAISCALPLDSVKFGQFCRSVAEKYVLSYSWHPMTVTIHKILVHGRDIIETNALPVGMLSEQAAESRNKFYRFDREHHCRKKDRETTMIDLFRRALESSDPVVSMTRLRQRQRFMKRLPLPAAVREMLKPVDPTDLYDTDDEDCATEQQCIEGNENEEHTTLLNIESQENYN